MVSQDKDRMGEILLMEVRIRNYEKIESLLLRIEGVTVISGKSNNGKSAIYRAIESLCLGQRGEAFIRDGARDCSVELFDGKNNFEWGRKGDTFFKANERTFTKTLGFPPEEYAKLLAIKNIELNKDLSLSPNFAGQFDPLFILGLSPSEVAAALSFLFSGEKFPDLLKTIAKQVKEDKNTIVFDEGRIEQLEKETIDLKARMVAIEPLAELFELRKKIPIWISGFRTVEADLAELDRLQKEKSDCLTQLQSATSANSFFASLNESLLAEVEKINADLGTLDDLHNSMQAAGVELQKVRDSWVLLSAVSEDKLKELEKLNEDITGLDKCALMSATSKALISQNELVLNALSSVSDTLPSELEALNFQCAQLDSLVREKEVEAQKVADNARELNLIMLEIPKVTQQLTRCPSCSALLDDGTKKYLLGCLEGAGAYV